MIHVAWGKAVGRRGSSATSTALSAHRRFVFFVHMYIAAPSAKETSYSSETSFWVDWSDEIGLCTEH